MTNLHRSILANIHCILMKLHIKRALLFIVCYCCIVPFLQSKDYSSTLKNAWAELYNDPQLTEKLCVSVIDSLRITQSTNNYNRVDALYLLGHSYLLQGDFQTGLSTLFEALEECREDDRRVKADINLLIGALYGKVRDSEKALDYIDRSKKIYASQNDSIGVALCYNNMGLVYTDLKQFVMAEDYFYKTLEITRRANSAINTAAALNNLGTFKGDTNRKIEQLKESIDITKAYDLKWSIGENYNNLGLQYYYAGQYQKALAILDSALVYAMDTNARQVVFSNYNCKSMIYEALGQYKKAHEYYKEAHRIEDEIQSEKLLRNVERSLSNQELFKKNAEIELIQKQHEKDTIFKTLIISIIIFVLILLLIYIFYRRYKVKQQVKLYQTQIALEKSSAELLNMKLQQEEADKQKIELQLSISKRDLTNFSYYIKSRNDILNKIKEQIKLGYRMDPSQISTYLKKINAFISQYETSDDNKLIFINGIDEYSDVFLARLHELHLDLTKSEKQLAIYLRIDMSTKDICLLTGSNVKAVSMARYRLRKRLNLDTEASLSEYLQSIQ